MKILLKDGGEMQALHSLIQALHSKIKYPIQMSHLFN